MIQTAATPMTIPAATRRPVTEADLANWRKLRDDKWSYEMIGRQCGRNAATIHDALKRGTPTRPAPRTPANLTYGYAALTDPSPAPRTDYARLGCDVEVVPCPPIEISSEPLRLALNEQWCRNCGEIIGPWMERWDGARRSSCCGRPSPVFAHTVLRPGEYTESGDN